VVTLNAAERLSDQSVVPRFRDLLDDPHHVFCQCLVNQQVGAAGRSDQIWRHGVSPLITTERPM
jgi:hypothetical protein